jgi:uncharacterized membrane protein
MSTEMKIPNIAIFSALVFAATFIIRITIPATGGYFNVGESMIYVGALLFGPLVGGLAGGVGASLVDALGYPIFVPGTFVIKLIEGAIVGFVGYKMQPRIKAATLWKAVSLVFGVILGLAMYYIGFNYLAPFGDPFLNQLTLAIVALFLAIFIISMSLKFGSQISWQTIAILLGGTAMVAGYFLYETMLALLSPGLGIYAFGEIPLNIGQMLVGMTIALPIVRAMHNAFPTQLWQGKKPT